MNRVERHIVVKDSNIDNLCFLSKNLYNKVNYLIRQRYFENKESGDKKLMYWGEYEMINFLTEQKDSDYCALNSQTSQQIILLLFKNWKMFYKNVKNKVKCSPPKYKDKTKGRNVIIFTSQQFSIKEGYIHFPKKSNLQPLKTNVDNVIQVRIVPNSSCYVIEVIYEKKEIKQDLDENLYLGIDLGINNLATLVTNSGEVPILVNGKIVKSVNQYYNKTKAKLMSYIGNKGISNRIKKLTLKRGNIIDNYLHHTSRFIINYCIENRIKNIVIGYNKGWKDEINIGKRNNQKFVSIPYYKLVNQIKYKAEDNGIVVILHEESYTSKCDSLASEVIGKSETYLGKRVKRGMFKSSINKLINADVNGAYNILRKVIGDSFVKEITNRGLAFNPVMVNPLQNFYEF